MIRCIILALYLFLMGAFCAALLPVAHAADMPQYTTDAQRCVDRVQAAHDSAREQGGVL